MTCAVSASLRSRGVSVVTVFGATAHPKSGSSVLLLLLVLGREDHSERPVQASAVDLSTHPAAASNLGLPNLV